MENLLALLCLALVFLPFIAVVGHLLWVLAASVFKRVYTEPEVIPVVRPAPTARVHEASRSRCIGCGSLLRNAARHCPNCGLDAFGLPAVELRDLENTARDIQNLVDNLCLDPSLGEQVYKAIEARQDKLLQTAEAQRQPETPRLAAVPTSFPDDRPWQPLDRLLSDWPDVARMPPSSRKRALAWYRQLQEADLARLSTQSLRHLAKLLLAAGLMSRALAVFDLLMKTYPRASVAAPALLEAGRIALSEGKFDTARRFLQFAGTGDLTTTERVNLLKLLDELPREEEIPVLEVSLPPIMQPAPAQEVQLDDSEKPEPETYELAQEPPTIPVVSRAVPTPPMSSPLPASPRPSSEPQVGYGKMLAGFMEERNILWGELVGGLLIVGCSIALVISLWRQLEQIPYFPFLAFAAITGACFGAGMYTLKRWKLEATSRGLLVIATLLAPLDFLVLAGLSRGREATLLDYAAELGAIVLFSAMTWIVGRVLVKPALALGKWQAEGLLTVAVVGAAATQLLVPRWLEFATLDIGRFVLFSLAPVLLQTAPLVWVLARLGQREAIGGAVANAFFLFLGLSAFATGTALGFIVYWSHDPWQAYGQLALPVALGSLPLLVGGALMRERLTHALDEGGHGLSPALGRVLATVLALIGGALLLGAIGQAWPRPLALLLVGLLNAAAFGLVAIAFRWPLAQAPAVIGLAIAWLVAAFMVLSGTDARLLSWVTSPAAAVPLTLLTAILAACGVALLRWSRRDDALIHLGAAALTTLLSLVLVLIDGTTTPTRGAFVYLASGLIWLLVNLRLREPSLTCIGSLLLMPGLAFVLFELDPNADGLRLWLLTALTHMTLMLIAGIGLTMLARWKRMRLEGQVAPVADAPGSPMVERVFAQPWRALALFSSLLALMPLVLSLDWSNLWLCETACVWLAGCWLALAWHWRSHGLFALFQGGLTAALLLFLTAWQAEQPGFAREIVQLFRFPTVQVLLLGVALLGFAWSITRRSVSLLRVRGPRDRLTHFLDADHGTFDSWVSLLLVPVQLLLAFLALLPEVLREIVTRPMQAWVIAPGALGDHSAPLAWTILAALTLISLLKLRESRPQDAVSVLPLLLAAAGWLIALPFAATLSAGSAARWSLSLAYVLDSLPLWLRSTVSRQAENRGIAWPMGLNLAPWLRVALLATTVLPVLLITGWIALLGMVGSHPLGPGDDSIFHQIGWLPSMLPPLVLIVIALTIHGWREKFAGYWFSAGWLLTATVAGGYALALVTGDFIFDENQAVVVVQLALTVAGAWGLAWLAARRCLAHGYLHLHLLLVLLGNVAHVLVAFITILTFKNSTLPGFLNSVAMPLGWLALGLGFAAAIWRAHQTARWAIVNLLVTLTLCLIVLAACATASADPSGWRAYHVLMLGSATVPGLVLIAACAGSIPGNKIRGLFSWAAAEQSCIGWAFGLSVCALFLTFANAEDPGRPYWSCAAVFLIGCTLGALAIWRQVNVFCYLSGFLACLIAFYFWQATALEVPNWEFEWSLKMRMLEHFILLQVLALACASFVWSALERRLERLEPPRDVRGQVLPFTHVAAWLSVLGLGLLTFIALAADLTDTQLLFSDPMQIAAFGLTGMALIALFWDAEAPAHGLPTPLLFVLGILAICLELHHRQQSPRDLLHWLAISIAAYAFGVALLARLLPFLAGMRGVLRLPVAVTKSLDGWFVPALALLALAVVPFTLWMCLDRETQAERFGGPISTLLLAGTAALLTSRWNQGQASREADVPALAALALGVLAGVEAGWAWMNPELPAPWLHRLVIVLAVLIVGAGLLFLLAARLSAWNPWQRAARQLAIGLSLLAVPVLVSVLIAEFTLFDAQVRHTPLVLPAVLFVLALLAGIIVALVWLAVWPIRDVFPKTPAGQAGLVYAAEGMVLVFFIHLRLNFPGLIPPELLKYWAMAALLLGFFLVGLAQLLERRRLMVLATPLRRTGLVLPIIPLLFTLARPFLDLPLIQRQVPGLEPFLRILNRMPEGVWFQTFLWFLFGLLFLIVAGLRRRGLYLLPASLACTIGLWVLLASEPKLAFTEHPQLWLIPLGLIVLVGEYFNRDRLPLGQAQTLRYLGLLLIYLSSSADMFINGLGTNVWLPLVLALLSVAGVLLGILLRVRAFLLLGVAFLFLDVFAQIWHAAVDQSQTWVWWASGIVLGAAILTLFALFEKRRNDVLKMMEEVKRWR